MSFFPSSGTKREPVGLEPVQKPQGCASITSTVLEKSLFTVSQQYFWKRVGWYFWQQRGRNFKVLKKHRQVQVSLFCFLRMQCQVLTENVHEHCPSIGRWGSSTAQCFWDPRLALLPKWDERGKERRVPTPMSAGITGQRPPWGGLRKERWFCLLYYFTEDGNSEPIVTSNGNLLLPLMERW